MDGYGWVVVREEGRREEGKEIWDGVLFWVGGGNKEGKGWESVGRVVGGRGGRLIHLVGGACSWVLWVGSGVEGGMLMVC